VSGGHRSRAKRKRLVEAVCGIVEEVVGGGCGSQVERKMSVGVG